MVLYETLTQIVQCNTLPPISSLPADAGTEPNTAVVARGRRDKDDRKLYTVHWPQWVALYETLTQIVQCNTLPPISSLPADAGTEPDKW
jgi:hypothetical protein